MNLPFSQFSTLINSILLVYILASCTENTIEKASTNTDSQTLIEYLKAKHRYELADKIKTVFILTENGCMSCNQKLAKLMANNLNKPHALFLVLAQGSRIDLSLFPQGKNNVLYDDEIIRKSYFSETKILLLKNKHIDSTLLIDAKQLPEQFRKAKGWLY